MSKNLIKNSFFVSHSDEVRVINSNDYVAKKLENLATDIKEKVNSGFTDSFSEGIAATEVAMLLRNEGEEMTEDGLEGLMDDNKGESPVDLQAISQNASDIIQKAKDEAAQIIATAHVEAQKLKDEAIERGRSEGYEEGYRNAQAAISAREEELEYEEEKLKEEYKTRFEEIETAMVDKITEVYSHVFNIELEDNKHMIMHLIHTTLNDMEVNKGFTIHVSKEDYPIISMQKKDIIKGTGAQNESIDIVEDANLIRGQCIIETESGIFDCSVTTQLENLRKDLLILSYSDK